MVPQTSGRLRSSVTWGDNAPMWKGCKEMFLALYPSLYPATKKAGINGLNWDSGETRFHSALPTQFNTD